MARGELLDPAAAMVVGFVVDCVAGFADYRSPEPSITATAQPGGAPYYSTSGTVDHALPGGGVITFVNLTPPTASIEVRRNGSPIARAVVPLRAGAVTTVTFN